MKEVQLALAQSLEERAYWLNQFVKDDKPEALLRISIEKIEEVIAKLKTEIG